MQLIAMSNGYTSGKVYLVWEIPHDNITGYEVYKNGVLERTSVVEDLGDFVSPTVFDHDHQTNLFKKDSTHKLMYVDENVQKYCRYEYYVVAKRLDAEGNEVERIESNTASVESM